MKKLLTFFEHLVGLALVGLAAVALLFPQLTTANNKLLKSGSDNAKAPEGEGPMCGGGGNTGPATSL